VRNECLRSPTRSGAGRSFAQPLPHPVGLRLGGSDCRRRREATLCLRFRQAQPSVLSRQLQTAPLFARAQTRTGGQTSAKCSGCEQTIELLLGCRSSFFPTYPRSFTLTTLERAATRNKPLPPWCRLVNNTTGPVLSYDNIRTLLASSSCSPSQRISTMPIELTGTWPYLRFFAPAGSAPFKDPLAGDD
jgi:hypothetical protein